MLPTIWLFPVGMIRSGILGPITDQVNGKQQLLISWYRSEGCCCMFLFQILTSTVVFNYCQHCFKFNCIILLLMLPLPNTAALIAQFTAQPAAATADYDFCGGWRLPQLFDLHSPVTKLQSVRLRRPKMPETNRVARLTPLSKKTRRQRKKVRYVIN